VKVGSIRMMARRERSEQGQQAGGTSAAPMAPICEAEAKRSAPSVCVTCVWAGVDNAWKQKKTEARKMLENAAESHTSGVSM